MLCSLAAAVFFAAPSAAQQPVYGGGLRAKSSVQPQPRPVATFATPFPTRPTPGPVRTIYDQPAPQAQSSAMPVIQPGATRPAAHSPRPGGAAAPGAAGKVLYFHKAENATAPDGIADNGTLAMAALQEPVAEAAAADVSAAPPGVPQPATIPATVIEKPIVPPNLEPTLPSQPFIPVAPDGTIPAFPAAERPVLQPEEKNKPEDKTQEPKKVDPKIPAGVLQLPPRAAIFTIQGDDNLEKAIYASIAAQLKKTPESLKAQSPFPPLTPTVPVGTKYVAKTESMPPSHVTYEPGYIIHRRLLFEEKNSERYGWDLGLATPFVSTINFYKHVLFLPHNLASGLVVGKLDTNAGKCLPGSPTPYYLYPPGLTITGAAGEGLVVTGLAFLIP